MDIASRLGGAIGGPLRRRAGVGVDDPPCSGEPLSRIYFTDASRYVRFFLITTTTLCTTPTRSSTPNSSPSSFGLQVDGDPPVMSVLGRVLAWRSAADIPTLQSLVGGRLGSCARRRLGGPRLCWEGLLLFTAGDSRWATAGPLAGSSSRRPCGWQVRPRWGMHGKPYAGPAISALHVRERPAGSLDSRMVAACCRRATTEDGA